MTEENKVDPPVVDPPAGDPPVDPPTGNDDPPNVDDPSDPGTGDDPADPSDPADPEETPEEKIERLEKTNKKLHARLKKQKPKSSKETKESVTPLLEEKLTLIAKGENADVITEAMDIAERKGITLKEAMKTPVLEAYKKEVLAEEKSKEAALGASGAGAQKTEQKFKEGMTREDHKKAWEENQGKG